MRKNQITLGIPLLFAAALLATGCGEAKPAVPVAAAAAPPVSAPIRPVDPALSAPSANASASEQFLVVSGPLIVEHQVDVTAQRDGAVAALSVDVDSHVKAGDELARLDDRQLAANLEAARARTRGYDNDVKNWQAETKMLEADYTRAQKLYAQQIWSKEQLDHAQYAAEADRWETKRAQELLNASQQDERSLELELEKARIVAPFDGVIARRYIRTGQTVSKGDRLFWVSAEGPLRMRFTLPEKFLGHVKENQRLALTSPDVPGETHTARVVEISPVVDPSSGTIEIVAELDGSKGSLRPGMSATIRVPNFR